jgi:very-short-patch-repair endonuclease
MLNFMTDSYNNNLHKGSTGKLHACAREMRKIDTIAESFLWKRLRNRKLNNLEFRRQHTPDKFIADFYWHERS